MQTRPRTLPALAAAILALATAAPGQHPPQAFAPASWLVVPQLRTMAFDPARHAAPVAIEAVRARIGIVDRTATTELEVDLRNQAAQDAEAVLLLPVPRGAVVSSFAFDGAAAGPTARLLPADEARRTYDEIVRRLRDPALLEFAGEALVRSSVFPVPGGGTQRLRLRYEHLLDQVGERIDYLLPRSESLEQLAPWSIEVRVRTGRTLTGVFSPSHPIGTERLGHDRATVRLAAGAERTPGSFRLSLLLHGPSGLGASMLAYPDPERGGGYFLLMAGLPPRSAESRAAVRRELTLVLDRSGSMAGGKMDQARAAALQVIEALGPDESFQIVDYGSDVARFAPAAVARDAAAVADARRYLEALRPGGGTDLHGALVEALRPAPAAGVLPIVLFLTDGLPTVGNTAEAAIRALAEAGNPHRRRIFTFGVGPDVNAPLLDRLAELSRAKSTYVLPEEDVELKVAQVFDALHGPLLCGAVLETLDEHGAVDTRRIREPMPARLPDLFEHDQLVVLGRYLGEEPLRFRLRGEWLGEERSFAFTFGVDRASTHNAFVPRLWASRRIAELVDEVRQAGADRPNLARTDPFADPRLAELRDEILALSTRFGVLSEYTAFLATEGQDLGDWSGLSQACQQQLDQKAIQTRSGVAAMNQAWNINAQKAQTALNPRNVYFDGALNPVAVATVQQVCDRAFFKRGPRWIDARLIEAGTFEPERRVRRGSPAHEALLGRLLERGQNALLSLRGEILLQIDGERILVVDGDE
jgi:Ca-activated chloride channel family protein